MRQLLEGKGLHQVFLWSHKVLILLTAFWVYKMPAGSLGIESLHKMCLQGGDQKTFGVLIRNQGVPKFELVVTLVDIGHFEVYYVVGRIELS